LSDYVSGLVWKKAPFTDARFIVLLSIADDSDDRGYSAKSGDQVAIATKSRQGKSATKKALRRLRTERIQITRTGRGFEILAPGHAHYEDGLTMMKVIEHSKWDRGVRRPNEYIINVGLLEALPDYEPGQSDLQFRTQETEPGAPGPLFEGENMGVLNTPMLVDGGTGYPQAVENSGDMGVSGDRHGGMSYPGGGRFSTDMGVRNDRHGGIKNPLLDRSDTDTDMDTRYLTLDGRKTAEKGDEGFRFTLEDRDPGDWDFGAVKRHYLQIVKKRELSETDLAHLDEIGRMKMSSRAVIRLMSEMEQKGTRRYRTAKYFLVGFHQLKKVVDADVHQAARTNVGADWDPVWVFRRTVARWQWEKER
jgi:hypothetical protein